MSLTDPQALAARRAELVRPHMVELGRLVAHLRARHGRVPDPDPIDGGTAARLLLLLESPGPRIDRTGLVSRDNPTGTARSLRRFLHEAAIPRQATLIWNAVPWVIHAPGARNRAPRRNEIAAGLQALPDLLRLLPLLQVVVLAGRVAGEARATVAMTRPEVSVLAMPHPSPTYVNTSPTVAARVRETLATAARLLEAGPSTHIDELAHPR